MKKHIEYFVQYDGQDRVAIGVMLIDDDGTRGAGTIDGDHPTLQAAAVKAGKTTWDEDTICAVHNLERAPVEIVALPVARL